MNDQSWINEIEWVSLEVPAELAGDEEIYTIAMQDFLNMPEMNFAELAVFDPQIRALMN